MKKMALLLSPRSKKKKREREREKRERERESIGLLHRARE
jgi:hypothetical protein